MNSILYNDFLNNNQIYLKNNINDKITENKISNLFIHIENILCDIIDFSIKYVLSKITKDNIENRKKDNYVISGGKVLDKYIKMNTINKYFTFDIYVPNDKLIDIFYKKLNNKLNEFFNNSYNSIYLYNILKNNNLVSDDDYDYYIDNIRLFFYHGKINNENWIFIKLKLKDLFMNNENKTIFIDNSKIDYLQSTENIIYYPIINIKTYDSIHNETNIFYDTDSLPNFNLVIAMENLYNKLLIETNQYKIDDIKKRLKLLTNCDFIKDGAGYKIIKNSIENIYLNYNSYFTTFLKFHIENKALVFNDRMNEIYKYLDTFKFDGTTFLEKCKKSILINNMNASNDNLLLFYDILKQFPGYLSNINDEITNITKFNDIYIKYKNITTYNNETNNELNLLFKKFKDTIDFTDILINKELIDLYKIYPEFINIYDKEFKFYKYKDVPEHYKGFIDIINLSDDGLKNIQGGLYRYTYLDDRNINAYLLKKHFIQTYNNNNELDIKINHIDLVFQYVKNNFEYKKLLYILLTKDEFIEMNKNKSESISYSYRERDRNRDRDSDSDNDSDNESYKSGSDSDNESYKSGSDSDSSNQSGSGIQYDINYDKYKEGFITKETDCIVKNYFYSYRLQTYMILNSLTGNMFNLYDVNKDDIFYIPNYLSTSICTEFNYQPFYNNSSFIFKILIKKESLNWLLINNYSYHDTEKELLIKRGSYLKVYKKEIESIKVFDVYVDIMVITVGLYDSLDEIDNYIDIENGNNKKCEDDENSENENSENENSENENSDYENYKRKYNIIGGNNHIKLFNFNYNDFNKISNKYRNNKYTNIQLYDMSNQNYEVDEKKYTKINSKYNYDLLTVNKLINNIIFSPKINLTKSIGPASLKYKNKYLKYKSKYLKLKNNIN